MKGERKQFSISHIPYRQEISFYKQNEDVWARHFQHAGWKTTATASYSDVCVFVRMGATACKNFVYRDLAYK